MHMLGKGTATNGREENQNENKKEEGRTVKDIADDKNWSTIIKGRDFASTNENKKIDEDSNRRCETEYLIEIDPRSHLEVADYPKHR